MSFSQRDCVCVWRFLLPTPFTARLHCNLSKYSMCILCIASLHFLVMVQPVYSLAVANLRCAMRDAGSDKTTQLSRHHIRMFVPRERCAPIVSGQPGQITRCCQENHRTPPRMESLSRARPRTLPPAAPRSRSLPSSVCLQPWQNPPHFDRTRG